MTTKNICCVCYKETNIKTVCNHYLCIRCHNKIIETEQNKGYSNNLLATNYIKCPICRDFLLLNIENKKYKKKYMNNLKRFLIKIIKYIDCYEYNFRAMFIYVKYNCESQKEYKRFINKIVNAVINEEKQFNLLF